MSPKSLMYNSVTVSLPKNAVQFMLGVVLFWLVYGSFSPVTASVALAAFLLAYSSVYLFNDITDAEEDAKDSDKKQWKLVASGRLGKRKAAVVGAAFLVSGTALASMVNVWFLGMMLGLLFLNFLHSSPYVRLKKSMPASAANMTAIEFLKYSSGWFALTGDLTAFPFWLILMFSMVYSLVYIVYKSRFKGRDIKSKKAVIVPLGLGSAFSYLMSVVMYEFALAMLLLLVMSIALAKFSVGKRLKFMNWLYVEFAILPVVVVAFLLLSIPPVAEANGNITATIDSYKQGLYDELPDEMADGIKGIAEPKYSSLDEIGEAINESLSEYYSDFAEKG